MNNKTQTKNVQGVEDLLIYKHYIELIMYTTNILIKFPKSERFGLNVDIRKAIYDGLEDILYAYRVFDKKEKLRYLLDLDVKFKFTKTLIRVAYRKKYISSRNYSAWGKKIFHIGNLLGGWISSCQKS